MADLTFTAGMGDAGVLSALDKFENAAVKSAHRSNKAFEALEGGGKHFTTGLVKGAAAAIGLHSAIELGTRAIEAYKNESAEAAAQVERVERAHQKMFASLGRDLMFGVEALGDVFASISSMREKAVNSVGAFFKTMTDADFWTGGASFGTVMDRHTAEINEANEAQRKNIALSKEMEQQALLAASAKEHQARMMAFIGDQLGADMMRAEIEYEQQLKEIAEKTKGMPTNVGAQMREDAFDEYNAKRKKAQDDDVKRKDEFFKKEEEAGNATSRAMNAEQTKRDDAVAAYEIERKKYSLSVDRLHMTKAQADAVEREIKLQEELLRIQKTDGLEASEKALLAAQAKEAAAADAVAALSGGPTKKEHTTGITAGASVIGLDAVRSNRTYAPANVPGLAEARENLAQAKAAVKSLINIDKSTARLAENGRASVATFAP